MIPIDKGYTGPTGLKRAIIPVLTLGAGGGVTWPAFPNPRWLVALLIMLFLTLLGLYGVVQTRAILRNDPVTGRVRWLFYDLRPYLRADIVGDDEEALLGA
jgi:hypothetical protein